MKPSSRWAVAPLLAGVLVLLVGCGAPTSDSAAPGSSPVGSPTSSTPVSTRTPTSAEPSRTRPTQSVLTGVVRVSEGYWHACAVKRDGSVVCWGANMFGQLGDGTHRTRKVPVPVTGLPGPAQDVVAASSHTCALTRTGTVWCWGNNEAGTLGDGTRKDRSTPVAVVGLDGKVTAISATDTHTCALLRTGHIQCWGAGESGQLGDGRSESSAVPVEVMGLQRRAVVVSTGDTHSCALLTDHSAWCWGRHLNADAKTYGPVPQPAVGLEDGVKALSAGGHHTCVLRQDGSVACWGYVYAGDLGDGRTKASGSPVEVTGIDGRVADLSVGMSFSCALTSSGQVWCWGGNELGERMMPITLHSVVLPGPITSLSKGYLPLLAVTEATEVVRIDPDTKPKATIQRRVGLDESPMRRPIAQTEDLVVALEQYVSSHRALSDMNP